MLAIPRWNGEKLFGDKTSQFGGVLIFSYAPRPSLKFRAGIYVNKEFFGTYIVPLGGIDWRINENNNLFGVLPGRLTYEHQWNDRLYSGATFRAITNSYRLTNGEFLRLDDNQVSIFIDYYLSKNICVTLEPGYGLFRKLRTGENDKNYIREADWVDGAFVKLSASYRRRLDEN